MLKKKIKNEGEQKMEENKKIIKGEKGVKGVTMLALVVTMLVH